MASIFKGNSVGSVIGVGVAAAKIWQAVTPRGLALAETPVAELTIAEDERRVAGRLHGEQRAGLRGVDRRAAGSPRIEVQGDFVHFNKMVDLAGAGRPIDPLAGGRRKNIEYN